MYRRSQSSRQSRLLRQIAVSNWELYCSGNQAENKNLEGYADFLARLALGDHKRLHGKEKPDVLLVREKQLSQSQYLQLFASVWKKVKTYDQKKEGKAALLIPHTFLEAAWQTGCGWLHLPLPVFEKYQEQNILSSLQVGTSVHSVEEAREAQKRGAAYILAGHIFSTQCKQGVSPRGLEFLEQVCASVTIPVYAIGGIHRDNLPLIQRTKAAGVCQMSEYMLHNENDK